MLNHVCVCVNTAADEMILLQLWESKENQNLVEQKFHLYKGLGITKKSTLSPDFQANERLCPKEVIMTTMLWQFFYPKKVYLSLPAPPSHWWKGGEVFNEPWFHTA